MTTSSSSPSATDSTGSNLSLPYFTARPAGAGPYPGVVVIQEANGISSQLLRFCQRLAAEGYAVAAPDLYYRVGGTESDDYGKLVASLDQEQTQGDIDAMATVLRSEGSPSVGIVGFCMGGRWAYQTAVTGSGFSAAAGFYGTQIAAINGEASIPFQLFFGGQDPWIQQAEVDEVAALFPSTVVYPTAGHGFMRDGSDDYVPEAAEDAWQRLLAFFGQHLVAA